MNLNAFTGMLPAAIEKYQVLLDALEAKGLEPRITGSYSNHGDDDDLRTWGVVTNISCTDPAELETEATKLGIDIQKDGSLAFLKGTDDKGEKKKLTIDDFKTLRVAADMKIQKADVAVSAIEKEVQ